MHDSIKTVTKDGLVKVAREPWEITQTFCGFLHFSRGILQAPRLSSQQMTGFTANYLFI